MMSSGETHQKTTPEYLCFRWWFEDLIIWISHLIASTKKLDFDKFIWLRLGRRTLKLGEESIYKLQRVAEGLSSRSFDVGII